MEFARSRMSGLLGFTIDQDGTVVKVDGLARTTGLQRGARVLQVETNSLTTYNHIDLQICYKHRYRDH